jgi:predicted ester cyclase
MRKDKQNAGLLLFTMLARAARIKVPAAFLLIAFCLLSCNNSTEEKKEPAINSPQLIQPTEDAELNKSIVKRFVQALNDTDWQTAGTMVADNYQHHYISDTGFSKTSWAGSQNGFRGLRNGFPDWRLNVEKIVGDNELVSVLIAGSGLHTGTFAGIPATKRSVNGHVMIMFKLQNGKIMADWEILDKSQFMKQLQR